MYDQLGIVPGRHGNRPIDSVYARLDDDKGLREQTEFARSLGFFGKSAIHPKQLATVHDVFTPSAEELAWAQTDSDQRGYVPGGEGRDGKVEELAPPLASFRQSSKRPTAIMEPRFPSAAPRQAANPRRSACSRSCC